MRRKKEQIQACHDWQKRNTIFYKNSVGLTRAGDAGHADIDEMKKN